MLVIEGADRLGKTTLAKSLSDRIKAISGRDVPVAHMGRRPANFHYLWGYWNRVQRWMIYDRFHLGALVYEREPKLTHPRLSVIRGRIRSHGGFTVILYRQPGSYLDLIQRIPDDKFPEEKLVAVNKEYLKMSMTHNLASDVEFTWGYDEYPDEHFINVVAERYCEYQKMLDYDMILKATYDTTID